MTAATYAAAEARMFADEGGYTNDDAGRRQGHAESRRL